MDKGWCVLVGFVDVFVSVVIVVLVMVADAEKCGSGRGG